MERSIDLCMLKSFVVIHTKYMGWTTQQVCQIRCKLLPFGQKCHMSTCEWLENFSKDDIGIEYRQRGTRSDLNL